MARVDTNQVAILQAILGRLRSDLALNDRNCYEAFNALDPVILPKGGDFFLVVGFGSGQFPGEFQRGGGSDQCTENTTLVVAIYSRIKTDRTTHASGLLRDAQRGLLKVKQKVMESLVNCDLIDADGNTFLRQTLYAQSCEKPKILSSAKVPIGLACLVIHFGVEFDWDLEE